MAWASPKSAHRPQRQRQAALPHRRTLSRTARCSALPCRRSSLPRPWCSRLAADSRKSAIGSVPRTRAKPNACPSTPYLAVYLPEMQHRTLPPAFVFLHPVGAAGYGPGLQLHKVVGVGDLTPKHSEAPLKPQSHPACQSDSLTWPACCRLFGAKARQELVSLS